MITSRGPNEPGTATRGQTLVEFAIAATVLFALILGIIEFGKAIYDYTAVANAAREGARYGAVHSTGIEAYAKSKAPGLDVEILVTPVASGATQIGVTARYLHKPITPLLPDIQMESTAHQFLEVH